MLSPSARDRPMRSPAEPSSTPPNAPPSMSAAVYRANQSPASPGVNVSPSKSRDTDSAASGINPNSMPHRTNNTKAKTSTNQRRVAERGTGLAAIVSLTVVVLGRRFEHADDRAIVELAKPGGFGLGEQPIVQRRKRHARAAGLGRRENQSHVFVVLRQPGVGLEPLFDHSRALVVPHARCGGTDTKCGEHSRNVQA